MRGVKKTSEATTAYVLLAPFLLVFAVFLAYPLIYSLQLSLYEVTLRTDWYDAFGAMRFCGLDNYRRLLTEDTRFWFSLVFTGLYGLLTVPAGIAAGLGLALLMDANLRGTGFYRAALFLPNVLDLFVVGTIWSAILAPQTGLLDRGLAGIGLPTPVVEGGLLGNPYWLLPTIAAAMVLKGAGFGMILMTTSLHQISPSLYEAAELDGAGPWQRFRHVTLPGIRSMLLFMAVTGTMACLNAFCEIYALTDGQGGPRLELAGQSVRPGDLAGFYLFRMFREGQYGYAAALSFVLMVLAVGLSLASQRLIGEEA